jgi:hypothetical protein
MGGAIPDPTNWKDAFELLKNPGEDGRASSGSIALKYPPR